MLRALDRLANEHFDLLIIGGGITGACVARDGALRGLKVALVERRDFANATSAHNSKLIHGGLRYLRNFELGLVRESLRERRIWQRIASHLVHPLPFLLPVRGGAAARAMFSAGLTLYDALAFDRNRLADPDQYLPGHVWLSKAEVLAREPVVEVPDLRGAFLYYDAQMYAPERLALECLIDADLHGAAIVNYVEASRLLLRNGQVDGAAVRDALSGNMFDVRAKATLVAAGPWADLYLERALGKPASHRLLRSKGIHVLVPALTKSCALTVAADSGHFFVLPWRGHTLLGTTDTKFTGDPDGIDVGAREIADFLGLINKHLPRAGLTPASVEDFYAGLRPLVDDGTGNTYGASRRAELVDHGTDDGLAGLFSAIGGKWTTSRALAEIVIDKIVSRLEVKTRPCATGLAVLPGGGFERFRAFKDEQRAANPQLGGLDHLARLYGARLGEVLRTANGAPELLVPFGPSGDIAAQVIFSMREELAVTLEDVVLRRTGIGQLGAPSGATLQAVSRLMAGEARWTEERRLREMEALAPRFRLAEAA